MSFISRLSAFLALIFLAYHATARPHNVSELGTGLATRDVPAAPHWVLYTDRWVSGENGPPVPSTITGFNVFILSFLLLSGPADQATEWASLSAADRASIKSQYAAAGIKLLVSAFGSTDEPTTTRADPVGTANTMAAWVKQFGLDGIDVDYEDFDAINKGDGSAETWLTTFTRQLRTQLPQGQYIITHAPVAPWFYGPKFGGGAYHTVNTNVGSLIDWYNVQFYNQGTNEYTTCDNLLTESSSTWPNSAVFQIAASGVDLNKIVIGKPALVSGDANNGFIDPQTLAGCAAQAKAKGWNAGVMAWEFPDAAASWITTVRSQSFPVSGGGSPPPPPPPTSTPPTSTSTSSGSAPTGGNCGSSPAWTSSVAYVGGSTVTFNGHLWTAKWWTEADTPGGAAGVWTDDGPC